MRGLERVTLIVATKNRDAFLIRLLRYYSQHGFPGAILIGDGSDAHSFDRVAAEVVALEQGATRLRHIRTGAEPLQMTFQRLADLVETDYVTLLGDDDYTVPSGLERCVEFLDANPDYIAANGRAWSFETVPDGPHGSIRLTGEYPQPHLIDGDPVIRLKNHMNDYRVALFSLHRVAAWREMWSRAGEMTDRTFGAELLPCCLAPVLGKIRQLDFMYLFRQNHYMTYHLPDHDDWVSRKEWGDNFGQFCDRLSAALARTSPIEIGQARMDVEYFFVATYLAHYTNCAGRASQEARDASKTPLSGGTHSPCPKEKARTAALGAHGIRKFVARIPFARPVFLRLFRWFWMLRYFRAALFLRLRTSIRSKMTIHKWQRADFVHFSDFEAISRSVRGTATASGD